jgi:pimeloyl-ACP methyl ester carboxylesterase
MIRRLPGSLLSSTHATPRARVAVIVTLALVGCAPEPAPEQLLPPDPDASAELGERGPYGAMVVRRELAHTDGARVTADVFVPTDADDAGPFPPIVFVQGGLVPIERYRWFGAHFASRGFVVASPQHPFDLAVLGADNGRIALGGLRAASDDDADELAALVAEVPALVAGHSLGGVIVTDFWLTSDADDVRHLALLASEPNPDSDTSVREDGPVVSVTGTADARLTPAEALAGAKRFTSAVVAASVEGMNHYQLTDAPTEGELDSDGVATRDEADSRRLALFLVDALAEDLREPAAVVELPDLWPDGLEPIE